MSTFCSIFNARLPKNERSWIVRERLRRDRFVIYELDPNSAANIASSAFPFFRGLSLIAGIAVGVELEFDREEELAAELVELGKELKLAGEFELATPLEFVAELELVAEALILGACASVAAKAGVVVGVVAAITVVVAEVLIFPGLLSVRGEYLR